MASNEFEKLKIEQLGTLHNVLTPVAYAYKHFGNQLQIENYILLEIEQTNCDFSEKLYKVLEYRLKQLPLLTWHDIVRALRSPAVHEQVLASEIESQYIPCSSSQPQLASDQSSAPIGPDSGANSPPQAMQHQHFPNQPQCYFSNPTPPPHQWLPQHQMHPPPPKQQMHLPYLHPQIYPPPTHHLPNTHPQIHPPHPQLSHPQHPPSQHPETYPSPPQPQMLQYPYSDSSQSFMKPKLSVNPPVIFSQPLTGRARKKSSFEKVNICSQAGSVSAKPSSFGLYSWQSQQLMAAPLSAKRHCVQPDPSPALPYSDSGSKALFNQFIQYVKILYRSSPVEKRPEVLKLRTPGKMFINLAFIDRKSEGLRTEYDEITEAMVRDGNVDVIEGRKCPIDMNAIAANLPEEALEKVILVEGAPGVGKSTFAWEFCRRWEREEIAQQYDLVLLLRLRDDRISKAKCLKDFVYHHSDNVCEAVVSELESCLGVNVLLILEGYDELPDKCRHQPSLFLELINGQVLPLATVLITSRPWATCDVRRKFEHRIFQHIEVLGFTKEQITKYIRSALSEEEALELEGRLRKQSTVRTCMYIPLNCAIVVKVYLECKANGVALPTTLSGFYETVSFAILLRYLRAIDISFEPIENFHNLPAAVKSKFCFLCQLAYDSIAGAGNQVKLIFTDLPKDFDGLGFMDSVFEFYETRKTVASHNFLHLTFQEFLAAVHISNMEAEQRLQHFKKHDEGRLRVVLRFLAGITKLKDFSTPSSFAGLLDQPRKCGYTAIEYTIRPHVYTWVYEALRKEIIKMIFKGDITVQLVCLKPVDFAAVAYIITHSHCKWILSLTYDMEENERGVDILLDEIQASDSTGGKIVGLTGGIDDSSITFNPLSISLKGLNRIFTGIPIQLSELALDLPARCSKILWPDLSSLQSLTLSNVLPRSDFELDYLLPQLSLSSLGLWFPTSSISLKDKEAVANFITKTSTLKELYIVESCTELEIEEIFVALQGKGFCIHFTLHIMGPECDIIENSDAKILASYIRTNTLSRLIFERSLFYVFGALQVARAIRDVPDLNADKLHCDECHVFQTEDVYHTIELTDYFDLVHMEQTPKALGDEEYLFGFTFLLPDSTIVEWEFMVNDGVGIRHVAEAVCSNSRVRTLKLCNNFYLSDIGAKALAEIFNCHIVLLEKLDLSHNRIGCVGTEALAQAVVPNTVLKKLVLSDNDVGDVGAKALAEVLNCNTILEELDLSDNNIGNVGADALAQAIGSNTALKKLALSCNKIGDVGTEALAQAIGSNTDLKKLALSSNDVGDVGAKVLAEVLKYNTILEELDLSDNNIGNVGANALAQAIGSNTELKKLALSSNHVGEVGAKVMAEVLKYYNTILEELYLSYSGIGDVGAEALAEAIVSNTALKKLYLSDNNVGDIGAKALAEVLNCNTILEELDLSCNEIGDVGAEAFAHAIGSNSALKKLNLSDNGVGDDGAIALARALHNSSLDVLNLSWNIIGESGAKAFAEALHHNSTITHLNLSEMKI